MFPETTKAVHRCTRQFSRQRQRHLRLMAGLTAVSLASIQTPAFAVDRFWQLGANGFWDVAANWGGSLPGAIDDVYNNTLFEINHRSGSTTVNRFRSLTASGGGGALIVSGGTLQINTQLDTDGNVTVSNGATLRGQSAAATTFRVGGNFALNNGTLSNVSVQNSNLLRFDSGNNRLENVALDGSLNLSPANSTVRILGTTTLGANPSFDLGNNASLIFQGDRTLNNTTVTSNTTGTGYLYTDGAMTLTLPSTFSFTGRNGQIRSSFFVGGGGIVANSGLIGPNVASGSFSIAPTEFQNLAGGIVRADGTSTSVSVTAPTFSNTGTIEALNGGAISIGGTNATLAGTLTTDGTNSNIVIAPSSSWILSSAVSASNNARVDLGGTFTLGAGNSLNTASGGLIRLTGTLDNTGTTFNVSSNLGGTDNFSLAAGRILNGTVNNSNLLRFDSGNNRLENVALDGSLNLSPANSTVRILGTTTFGANPSFDLGSNSSLIFQGDRTLSNTTVTSNTTGTGYLYTDGAMTLTLPRTFSCTGRNGQIRSSFFVGGGGIVTNAGLIGPNVASGSFSIAPTEFQNLAGGIARADGTSTSVGISPTTFSNSGTLEALNGGAINITATNATVGGTLTVTGNNSSLSMTPTNLILTTSGISDGTNNFINIAPTNSWVLSTALSAVNNGRVDLGGTFTLGAGNSLTTNSNGLIRLTGTLNNTATTFDVATNLGGTDNFQMTGGRILNGTVNNSNLLRFDSGNNRLENVALDGSLNLSPANSTVRILGTTTFGANPSFDLGSNSSLIFQGDRTLNNTTLTSSTTGTGYLYTDGAMTLTLPSTFSFTGRNGQIRSSFFVGGGGIVTNAGLIGPNVASGSFTIAPTEFQNLAGGIVRATGANANVTISPTNDFTNTGTLDAQNGGSVTLSTTNPTTNTGTIQVGAGSSFSTNENLVQTAGLTDIDGTFTANGGANDDLLDIQDGTLQGSGRIQADVRNDGLVLPGDSPGILTITRNYVQTSNGILGIEINGATLGTGYDQLAVTGTGTIAGTLNVTLNYVPQTPTTYTIATFGSYTGTFSTLNIPSNLEILYNSNTIQLRAVPAPGSLIGLCIGLTGLGVILRRRRK